MYYLICSENRKFECFALAVILIGIFSSVTNLIPLVALPDILIAAIPFYFLNKKECTDKCFKIMFSLLAIIFVFSAMYYYKQIYNYDFYRRDGNVFVTYSAMLFFLVVDFNFNPVKVINKFLIWSCAVAVFTFVLWGTGVFNVGPSEYSMLFKSHNAAGGFLALILSLSFFFWSEKKNKFYFAIMFFALVCFISTESRGTILAVIAAALVMSLVKKREFRIYLTIFSCLFFSFAIGMYAHSMIPRSQYYPGDEPSVEIKNYNNASQYMNFGVLERENVNTILIRMGTLWPRAIDLFYRNPYIGYGFGSYDDRPYEPYKFNSSLEFNNVYSSGNVRHTSSHAHNSFLNFAAEMGLVGIIIVLIFSLVIHSIVLKVRPVYISKALELSWLIVLFSSLTEHRLTTPSQVLPIMLITGLLFSCRKYMHNNKGVLTDAGY
ncbi:O-antigen ligase family protein [Kushneria sp. AK178]